MSLRALVLVLVTLACGERPPKTSVVDGCLAALRDLPADPATARERFAAACSAVFSRPACRDAWAALATGRGSVRQRTNAAIYACQAAYCPDLAAPPRACFWTPTRHAYLRNTWVDLVEPIVAHDHGAAEGTRLGKAMKDLFELPSRKLDPVDVMSGDLDAAPVIAITATDVTLNGIPVATVAEVEAAAGWEIPALRAGLLASEAMRETTLMPPDDLAELRGVVVIAALPSVRAAVFGKVIRTAYATGHVVPLFRRNGPPVKAAPTRDGGAGAVITIVMYPGAVWIGADRRWVSCLPRTGDEWGAIARALREHAAGTVDLAAAPEVTYAELERAMDVAAAEGAGDLGITDVESLEGLPPPATECPRERP